MDNIIDIYTFEEWDSHLDKNQIVEWDSMDHKSGQITHNSGLYNELSEETKRMFYKQYRTWKGNLKWDGK